jgi:Flp pilus assembly protein TadG
MRSLKKVLRDEKGASIILVAIAIVAILGFAVLAVDLSFVQLAKTQLQNAADASAMAGARLLCNGGSIDSARAEAIRIAGLNVAVQDTQRSVIINNSDVQFLGDTITVTTHRTDATGDPLIVHFLRVINPLSQNKVDVTATASAICGTRCLRPFCPPDRWYDANGDELWNPDSGDYYDPVTTGYMAPTDIGDTVVLYRNGPSAEFKMGWYYPVRFPGYSGASDYSEWIADCVDPSVRVRIGDRLEIEPGGMVGPTKQGLSDLMSQDPGAFWDDVADTVGGSAFAWKESPRIIKCPAFDPIVGVESSGGPGWVTIVKIIVIFVEGYDTGGNIIGRFVDIGDDSVYEVFLVK